jgi:predicted outer membrane repeat protein
MMRSLTARFARKLFSGSKKPSRTPTFKPRMECLEDRLVPATLTVNTHLDLATSRRGVLSLREAIAIANHSATPDTIVLASGTYTLSLGQLTITNSMTIRGQGYWLTAVDGANLSRLFQVNGVGTGINHAVRSAGIVLPPPPGTNAVNVTFANMSLQHGLGTQGGISGQVGGGAIQASSANLNLVNCELSSNSGLNGGAINDSNGNVTLTGSLVSGNTAQNNGGAIAMFGGKLVVSALVQFNSTQGNGGGVFTTGSVTLNGSDFYYNSAVAGGGALYTSSAAQLTNSKLVGNSAAVGGGIWAASVTLNGSSVLDSSATFDGGGIYDFGPVTVTNSILTGNHSGTSGGGIAATSVTMTGSTVSGNTTGGFGGGISSGGTVNLTNSTVSDNSAATNGGGLFVNSLLVTNSTVSGNSASGFGGGVYVIGVNYFLFDTIAENTAAEGGGVYKEVNGAIVRLQDTIIALNRISSGGAGPDVHGSFQSFGNNLIGILDSSAASWFTNGSGDQLGTPSNPLNPGLSALGNFGGPTQTYALLPGSKAINAGVNPPLAAIEVAVGAGTTTFFPGEVANLAVGMVLRLDQELVLVVAVDPNARTLTVRRGVNGTIATAHSVNAALFLATDQRGVLRPTNGPVDIGAFQ